MHIFHSTTPMQCRYLIIKLQAHLFSFIFSLSSLNTTGFGCSVLSHSPLKALTSQFVSSVPIVSNVLLLAIDHNLLSYTILLALWK